MPRFQIGDLVHDSAGKIWEVVDDADDSPDATVELEDNEGKSTAAPEWDLTLVRRSG